MSRYNRRGANAVEFAILMPLFVVLVTASMELGWQVNQRGAARTAVNQACRKGAMADPGRNEGLLAGVLSASKEDVSMRFSESVGDCPDCVASTTAVGEVPNRALRCTLRVPRRSLTGLIPVPKNSLITATVRLEYQRRVRR